eukprot:2636882-Prymnesium_polylepis.1
MRTRSAPRAAAESPPRAAARRRTAKSAENGVKTLAHPLSPTIHSCVPPLSYAKRFEKAMKKWIL